MTPEDFAKEFRMLKDDLVKGYFTKGGEISRIQILKDAGLSDKQIEVVGSVFSDGLIDALYTVLLGLDGCATIGSEQNDYVLKDEDGNLVAGSGELESYAWEEFHGSQI
ncbi:hypothetical protein [Shewanella colwelliana]|uniref:hypothetical protein n=1 Tax=Shewanella colwelliana TaxID=23 RepID=UPI003736049D